MLLDSRTSEIQFNVAGLRFSSGAVGSLVVGTASFPQRPETIILHCENGSMRLSAQALDIDWRDGRTERLGCQSEHAEEKGAELSKYDWHQAIIEDFIDAIRIERAPVVSGRTALESQRLIAAIEASSDSGAMVQLASV